MFLISMIFTYFSVMIEIKTTILDMLIFSKCPNLLSDKNRTHWLFESIHGRSFVEIKQIVKSGFLKSSISMYSKIVHCHFKTIVVYSIVYIGCISVHEFKKIFPKFSEQSMSF